MLEFEYSRLPIIRTFKGNGKKFELSGFRVIEGKIIWKLFGREKKFELAGGSSYGGRGTQREYSSKPLKYRIVKRIFVFKR